MSVSAVLAYIHVKDILITEINHARHLKHLGRVLGPTIAKTLHIGGLTKGRKIQIKGKSRSMKFVHNVDYDIIKITGESNLHIM